MKKFIGGFVFGIIFGNIFKTFCASIVCHKALDKAVNKKIDIPETEPVEKTEESCYYALMWDDEFIKISKETFEKCEAENSPVVNTSIHIVEDDQTIHYHILLPDKFKKILTNDFAKNVANIFMKTIGFDDAVYDEKLSGYYDENGKNV